MDSRDLFDFGGGFGGAVDVGVELRTLVGLFSFEMAV
jgi:hypothetical protein